jgi:uncharacterized protein with GYD domain
MGWSDSAVRLAPGLKFQAQIRVRDAAFPEPVAGASFRLTPKKGTPMARYITLLRFTETGAKNVRKSTTRAHAFDKLAARSGVTVEGQYWTLGGCDGVLILEADGEEKILHLLGQLAALGNVRTETMQAFNDKEFDRIVR